MDKYEEFMDILKQNAGLTIDDTFISESLPEVMSLAEVETMAQHLSWQLQALERRGCSLLFWQAADIWWVNKKCYLLAVLEQVVPLHKKTPEQIMLTYPAIFPLPQAVCAPELLKMNVLPFVTHKSLSYYSLALLCLQKVNLSLTELQGTKLFYFLERCLREEPSERCLYF
jgi:hypothetical protein